MGKYLGTVKVEWARDNRDMILLEPFSYLDNYKMLWTVPVGARINGASIPQILWDKVGSPYAGRYREASVIHDHYCVTKERSQYLTHLVFYEAMLTSGVGRTQARMMYLAVKNFGPKW